MAQLYFHNQKEGINKLYISLDRLADLGYNVSDILSAYEELMGQSFEKLDSPLLLFLDEAQYQS